MWAAHAAAAAVTILAIYQGERVVRRLRTLAVTLVRVLLPVVSVIPVPFRAAARADIETVSLPRSLSVYPSTRSRRGPPAVFFPSLPLATRAAISAAGDAGCRAVLLPRCRVACRVADVDA